MKKKIMYLTMICVTLLMAGCGNKTEPSEISCKFSQKENDLSVIVKMEFKRDNEKKIVTSGQLVMSYDLRNLSLGNEEDKNGVDSFEEIMFSSVCDNIGDNYTDCNVVETESGVDIIMAFNLDNLAKTSAGQFHKNMTIAQIKSYIMGRNENTDMICTTK